MKRSAIAIAISFLSIAGGIAQTRIVAPANNYSPAQDVELGQQAATQARQTLPVMRDEEITAYVQTIGRRLVDAIPPDLRHPEFGYTFEVVNVREINAFALPGGPMFVNRGMIEAAHAEGEVAGVMAHELSHVILRHGTAQASTATKYEIGQIAGAVLGSIIGGGWGQVISRGTQFGLGASFLRFSREYERDADLEGSHLMASAGYDPRDMANIFKTIEKQGGPGGPQWLSDHPNPGNRYAYINAEAQRLPAVNPTRDTRAFQQAQAYLKRLPPAPTTEEAAKNAARSTGTSGRRAPLPGRVEAPSSSYRTYSEGNLFRVSVPENWEEVQSNSRVTFAPDGAYAESGDRTTFTHGVEFGVSRNESHDLQSATDHLIQALAQGNPRLTRASDADRVSIANRRGLRVLLRNGTDASGRDEIIELATMLMRDGNLFYAIAVAPEADFSSYRSVFDRIFNSVQLLE